MNAGKDGEDDDRLRAQRFWDLVQNPSHEGELARLVSPDENDVARETEIGSGKNLDQTLREWQLAVEELKRRKQAGETLKGQDYSSTLPELTAPLAAYFNPKLRSEFRVNQRYIKIKRLGEGGYGEVWAALDMLRERFIAIKLLRKQHRENPAVVERFFREAKVMSQLQHPNIVSFHELREPPGDSYIITDLIEGITLADYVTPSSHSASRLTTLTAGAADPAVDLDSSKGRSKHDSKSRENAKQAAAARDAWNPIEPDQAARWCLSIGQAMEYVHTHRTQIIHRDLKPNNVMVTNQGEIKILDFGLSTRLNPDDSYDVSFTPEKLARRAGIVGTLAWCSPEQLRGEAATVASDIYGIGAILYFLLTTDAPYVSKEERRDGKIDPRVIADRQRSRPPSIRRLRSELPNCSDCPESLERICLKALAHAPEDRYPSAQAMVDDLQAYLDRQPVAAPRVQYPWRPSRRQVIAGALFGLPTATALGVLAKESIPYDYGDWTALPIDGKIKSFYPPDGYSDLAIEPGDPYAILRFRQTTKIVGNGFVVPIIPNLPEKSYVLEFSVEIKMEGNLDFTTAGIFFNSRQIEDEQIEFSLLRLVSDDYYTPPRLSLRWQTMTSDDPQYFAKRIENDAHRFETSEEKTRPMNGQAQEDTSPHRWTSVYIKLVNGCVDHCKINSSNYDLTSLNPKTPSEQVLPFGLYVSGNASFRFMKARWSTNH